MLPKRIIIGTRGSKLARAQASILSHRIQKTSPDIEIAINIVLTTGDRDTKSSLSEIGGKGIFIRELEQALLEGTIDMAVHSFKDVTSLTAPGLSLVSFLCPESVSDVMVTHNAVPFEQLPSGARIGTGSMRRRALLLKLRPDLTMVEIRGNIDTRIAKVDRGEYDGIMLSEAGLIRLGIDNRIATRFDPALFYPAPGQGVITVETRNSDAFITSVAIQAGDRRQNIVSTAELSLLSAIGFDCRTPLGVYSTIRDNVIIMKAFYVDSSDVFHECSEEGSIDTPDELGKTLANRLLPGSAPL